MIDCWPAVGVYDWRSRPRFTHGHHSWPLGLLISCHHPLHSVGVHRKDQHEGRRSGVMVDRLLAGSWRCTTGAVGPDSPMGHHSWPLGLLMSCHHPLHSVRIHRKDQHEGRRSGVTVDRLLAASWVYYWRIRPRFTHGPLFLGSWSPDLVSPGLVSPVYRVRTHRRNQHDGTRSGVTDDRPLAGSWGVPLMQAAQIHPLRKFLGLSVS